MFPMLLLGGCLNTPQLPATMPLAGQAHMPQYAKNRVYVFLIEGADPLDWARLASLRKYLMSQGYIKTYLGPSYYSTWYAEEVRRIRAKDPEAHFVFMGAGMGLDAARATARALEADHTLVDLLVALEEGGA